MAPFCLLSSVSSFIDCAVIALVDICLPFPHSLSFLIPLAGWANHLPNSLNLIRRLRCLCVLSLPWVDSLLPRPLRLVLFRATAVATAAPERDNAVNVIMLECAIGITDRYTIWPRFREHGGRGRVLAFSILPENASATYCPKAVEMGNEIPHGQPVRRRRCS